MSERVSGCFVTPSVAGSVDRVLAGTWSPHECIDERVSSGSTAPVTLGLRQRLNVFTMCADWSTRNVRVVQAIDWCSSRTDCGAKGQVQFQRAKLIYRF